MRTTAPRPARALARRLTGASCCPPGSARRVFADNIGHARHLVGDRRRRGLRQYLERPLLRRRHIAARAAFWWRCRTPRAMAMPMSRPASARRRGGRRRRHRHRALQGRALCRDERSHPAATRLPAGEIAPTAPPDVIVSGLPLTGDHPMHPFAIDAKGGLYVDLGSATNACQAAEPHAELAGPRALHGAARRAAASGAMTPTGPVRNSLPRSVMPPAFAMPTGIAVDPEGRGIYATQHGRDQLAQNWPKLYTAEQGANLPAEELLRVEQGRRLRMARVLLRRNAEASSSSRRSTAATAARQSVCAPRSRPVAAFPGALGAQRSGFLRRQAVPSARIAAASSSPFTDPGTGRPCRRAAITWSSSRSRTEKRRGKYVVFADGFAGAVKEPGKAAHRPSGVAVGPDGALYISDDQHGRIWKVTYHGDAAKASDLKRRVRVATQRRHSGRESLAARRHPSRRRPACGRGRSPSHPAQHRKRSRSGAQFYARQGGEAHLRRLPRLGRQGYAAGSQPQRTTMALGRRQSGVDHANDQRRRAQTQEPYRRDASHGRGRAFAQAAGRRLGVCLVAQPLVRLELACAFCVLSCNKRA